MATKQSSTKQISTSFPAYLGKLPVSNARCMPPPALKSNPAGELSECTDSSPKPPAVWYATTKTTTHSTTGGKI